MVKAYDDFKKQTDDIFKKIEKQRTPDRKPVNLSIEERQRLDSAITSLENSRNEYFQSIGLSDSQIAFANNSSYEWVQGSKSMPSTILKSVVAEINGSDFSKEAIFKEDPSKPMSGADYYKRFQEIKAATEKDLGGHDALLDTVKAEMQINQAIYKSDYPNGTSVSRGSNQELKPGTYRVDSYTLSSFSTSPEIAKGFGNTILTAKANPDSIMFYYKAAPAMMRLKDGLIEAEVVPMAKDQKIKVTVENVKSSVADIEYDSEKDSGLPKISIVDDGFEEYLHEQDHK